METEKTDYLDALITHPKTIEAIQKRLLDNSTDVAHFLDSVRRSDVEGAIQAVLALVCGDPDDIERIARKLATTGGGSIDVLDRLEQKQLKFAIVFMGIYFMLSNGRN